MTGIGSTTNSLGSFSSSTSTAKSETDAPLEQAAKGASSYDASPATILTLSSDAGTTSAAPKSESFSDVTTGARAALDANLATLKASGRSLGFGENQGSQADIDAAFKGLDRRAIYAIASNSGNLFSKDEQTFAQTALSQQQAAATGIDKPGFLSDPSAGFLAGVRFLDTVSPEEKASDNWRVNRAGVQASYESNFRSDHPGQKAEDVDSGDPVVNLLAKAIHDAAGTASSTTDGSYVTDIGKISIFADGKNDAALDQARAQPTRGPVGGGVDLLA